MGCHKITLSMVVGGDSVENGAPWHWGDRKGQGIVNKQTKQLESETYRVNNQCFELVILKSLSNSLDSAGRSKHA